MAQSGVPGGVPAARRTRRRAPGTRASSSTSTPSSWALASLEPAFCAGHEVVGLPAHRCGGLAAGGADGRLCRLAVERLERAGDDDGLARQWTRGRGRIGDRRWDRDHAHRCQVAQQARRVGVIEEAADGRRPPRRRCRAQPRSRSDSAAARASAMRAVHAASSSPASIGQVVAIHSARSMAVCSPTWRMPSAARMRESGRRRERSMAAMRLSALFWPNRSRSTRSSARRR